MRDQRQRRERLGGGGSVREKPFDHQPPPLLIQIPILETEREKERERE